MITGVEGGSAASEKRLSPGDVIVEVAQEAMASADAVQKRIDTLKREGKKSALLLVANAEGEVRRSFNGSYPPIYQCAYMLGAL